VPVLPGAPAFQYLTKQFQNSTNVRISPMIPLTIEFLQYTVGQSHLHTTVSNRLLTKQVKLDSYTCSLGIPTTVRPGLLMLPNHLGPSARKSHSCQARAHACHISWEQGAMVWIPFNVIFLSAVAQAWRPFFIFKSILTTQNGPAVLGTFFFRVEAPGTTIELWRGSRCAKYNDWQS
jgi:hypothetical protein